MNFRMRLHVMIDSFVMKRKKRTICFILILSIAILTGVTILGLFSGGDDHPESNGLCISVNKAIFSPGDKMRVFVGIKASRIDASTADVYLAVRDPSGSLSLYYNVPDWIVVETPPVEIASIPLRTIGPYTLYFVLCHPGLDPFDPGNWVAGVREQVFLLPGKEVASPYHNPVSFPDAPVPVLIAHGGGEIQGLRCTNTREALDRNYARGHRHFEMDFCWTTDERLVLIHDWQRTFTSLFLNVSEIPTLEQFERMEMKRNFTQMSLGDLYRWLSKHDDAHIITDVKERNPAALTLIARTAGTLKDRFIPQIYDTSEYKLAKELGFKDVILTLYRTALTDAELIGFVAKNKVFAVTMPVRRAFSFTGAQDLGQNETFVYVHTINRVEVLRYLRKKGVRGIYTDRISPDEIPG